MNIIAEEKIIYTIQVNNYELGILYQALRFVLPEFNITDAKKRLSTNDIIQKIERINPELRSNKSGNNKSKN